MSTEYFYNVVLVFDYFSITATVEASDEDKATDVAIRMLEEELGAGINSYNYVEVMAEG